MNLPGVYAIYDSDDRVFYVKTCKEISLDKHNYFVKRKIKHYSYEHNESKMIVENGERLIVIAFKLECSFIMFVLYGECFDLKIQGEYNRMIWRNGYINEFDKKTCDIKKLPKYLEEQKKFFNKIDWKRILFKYKKIFNSYKRNEILRAGL